MKTKILLCLIILAAAAVRSAAQTNEPAAAAAPAPAAGGDAATSAAAPAAPATPAADTGTNMTAAAGAPAPADTGTNAAGSDAVATKLSFDEMSLPDVVRQLATLAGLNITFDPRLLNQTGPNGPIPPPTVSEKWFNVTAMQALRSLLNNYGWQMEVEPGNPIVRIVAKDPKALEPLVTRVVLLEYAEPTNLVLQLKPLLGDRSSVLPDVRTHKIVLRATAGELPEILKLITQLDSSPRQVLIEAKIVETQKNLTSAKGVDWTGTLSSQHVSFGNGLTSATSTGAYGSGTATTGTASTGSTSSSATPGTGSTPSTTPGGRSVSSTTTSTTASSTASTAASAVGTATAFANSVAGLASAGPGFSANTSGGITPATAFLNADGVAAILSFLNTDADTRTISFPRTVSLDGVSNVLAAIRNVPIFEQSQSAPAAGASQGLATVLPNYAKIVAGTILNEVGVKLTVIPRIAGLSNVLIQVRPEISQQEAQPATDTLNGNVNTSPIFDRRVVFTTASVPSGYTLVLGGMDQDTTGNTATKVPGLGDLPGLGYLFRSSNKTHIRDTVLIFLTPTIIQATDFQPALGNFEKTRDSLMPTAKDGPWLSAQPYDWTKPKPVVQPVYQP